MEKMINYPTQEWLDAWVDRYMEQHPEERITDFTALNEQAESAWWDNEVEHNRPTPFDLTPEQQKASKEARMGAKNEHKFVKRKEPVKRERKPNQVKRDVIEALQQFCAASGYADVTVANIEREISFKIGEKTFSLTLVEHRAPKTDAKAE